jgi:hypothetical protein
MPSIRCWADDATFEGLLITSIVPGLFFVVGVLLIYSYVMIYLVRKRGSDPTTTHPHGTPPLTPPWDPTPIGPQARLA